MSAYSDLKTSRPIRFILAVTIYRLLWWPALAIVLPFALIGAFIDWLSWTGFPAIARAFRPAFGGIHGGALTVGNRVLGYEPALRSNTEEQP